MSVLTLRRCEGDPSGCDSRLVFVSVYIGREISAGVREAVAVACCETTWLTFTRTRTRTH